MMEFSFFFDYFHHYFSWFSLIFVKHLELTRNLKGKKYDSRREWSRVNISNKLNKNLYIGVAVAQPRGAKEAKAPSASNFI